MALPKNQPRNDSGPGAPVEGGGDLALALGTSVQNQTQEMVLAATAAQISIHQAADQLSDYFARVASGQELLNEILAMTQEKLEAMGGPVTIDTTVQPIVLNLPQSRDYGQTVSGFRGLFAPKHDIPAHYIISGPDSSDSEGEDNA